MDVLTAIQALADPTRFAVFQCIRGCGGTTAYDTATGECDAGSPNAVSMCEVKCRVPCAPSTLTHHLNTLRDAGLIETEKRGRKVYAKIRPEGLRRVIDFLGADTK